MNMTTSSSGIQLIKEFEGCRLQSYQDIAGVWTVGYGYTGLVNGIRISAGLKINHETAEQLLNQSIKELEKYVNDIVGAPLTQGQFDALVSFTFNLGPGRLKKSTLLKHLKNNDIERSANEFLKWNRAGGKAVTGLSLRRKKEMELFLS